MLKWIKFNLDSKKASEAIVFDANAADIQHTWDQSHVDYNSTMTRAISKGYHAVAIKKQNAKQRETQNCRELQQQGCDDVVIETMKPHRMIYGCVM